MNKKHIETMYPLSPAQQGMFYETEHAPRSGMYIEQFICTLAGPLDLSAFEQSWEQIVRRHAALRTAFVWSAQPEQVQVVMKEVPLPVERQDWRGLSAMEQRERLTRYLEQDRLQGFKLARPPLMRLALFQTGEQTFEFLWTHHHILMDGWCSSLVMKEFLTLYHAFTQKQVPHLEASRPYRDYIAWLLQRDTAQAEAFWRRHLAGITAPTPPGKEVVVEQWPALDGERYGMLNRVLSAATMHTLQARVRQHHLTLNTLVQGVWALLLATYNQVNDVVFGITVSGRPAELPGIETMVGLCINTLPLRVRLAPEQALWTWLAELQAHNLEFRQYEYSSAGQVRQWSDVPGTLPLYESLLVVENYPVDFSILDTSSFQLKISAIRSIGAQTSYPLTLLMTAASALEMRCVYDRGRFDERSAASILAHLGMLLEEVAVSATPTLVELQRLVPAASLPQMRVITRAEAVEEVAHEPIVELLQSIWQEVLGLPHVGIHEDFFTLGGHSLLATQLSSRIRADLQVELPLRALFEASTIALQARRIIALQQGIPADGEPALQPVARDGELPLSFAQQCLWYLAQLVPGSSSYNTPLSMRLRGKLDIVVLKRCLEQIVRRHEALRTTFAEVKGQLVQVIQPYTDLRLPLVDLTDSAASEKERAAHRLAADECRCPLSLQQNPLIRMVLVRLTAEEHVLVVTVHHIAFDAWSAGVFLRELEQLYEALSQGLPSPLADLPIQYADFACWQRAWLQGEVLDKHLGYWQNQLRGASLLNMPTDRPRPEIASFRGAVMSFTLPAQLSQQLKTLSCQQRTTLFMTLLTAFQILLHQYTGQEDIVLGTDIASRTRAEMEPLIGFFVNLLVMRTNLGGNPRFCDLLQRVREMVLNAYAHQSLPFEKLIEMLRLERKHNQTPLVRALFVMQNVPLPELEFAGVTISPFDSAITSSKFDFAVFLQHAADGISGSVNFSTDLFDESTIARMIHHFETLLQNIVLQPDAFIDTFARETEQEQLQRTQQEALQRTTHERRLKHIQREKVSLPAAKQAHTVSRHC